MMYKLIADYLADHQDQDEQAKDVLMPVGGIDEELDGDELGRSVWYEMRLARICSDFS